ncbi:MAG: hypothetical protein A2W99_02705 [Bacteroidetes bacterium GWF2_33_16]|nr:MAG: hypothetical protein A2X00_07890 [Bacteroidetes bacterium GWE2_32_14]OFY07377.1 MAG: hypothetical protein A2W99_02705 [Bacteroidetes bacterium GWF2_33_16]
MLLFILLSFEVKGVKKNIMPQDNKIDATKNATKSNIYIDSLQEKKMVPIQYELDKNNNYQNKYLKSSPEIKILKGKDASPKVEVNNFINTKPSIKSMQIDSFDKMWQDIIGVAWFGGYNETNKNDILQIEIKHDPRASGKTK